MRRRFLTIKISKLGPKRGQPLYLNKSPRNVWLTLA